MVEISQCIPTILAKVSVAACPYAPVAGEELRLGDYAYYGPTCSVAKASGFFREPTAVMVASTIIGV